MDYNASIPIYLQVIDKIKKQLVTGELQSGDKLPSSRNLAIMYEVNPNTAARIYKEMESMGICFTKRGLGTFVTESQETIHTIKNEMAEKIISDFINEMYAIGYTHDDMLKIIKERGKNA